MMALLNSLHYISEPQPNKVTVEFFIKTNVDLLRQLVQNFISKRK
jgi:hypothetical protein